MTKLGILLFAIGCTAQAPKSATGGDDQPSGEGHEHGNPPAALVCQSEAAPGTVLATYPIAGGAIVATDNLGNVFYTALNAGFVKLDAAGNRVYDFAFGSVLAVDAAGNAYVAGSFTSPIDLGLGEMTPNGNIDVFVAKLSPSGKVLFARQLGLCGDGIQAIAVDAHGRIGLSGTALGTVVLDERGHVIFTETFAGKLAFDSKGDLVVAGSFAGSIDFGGGHVLRNGGDFDGFVVMLDPFGNHLWSIDLGDAQLPVDVPGFGAVTTPRDQFVTAIAINASDQIALIGTFRYEMDLFGQTLTMPPSIHDIDGVSGSFVVKLEASGRMRSSQPLGPTKSMFAVAIDLDGNISVSLLFPGSTCGAGYAVLEHLGDRWTYQSTAACGAGLGVAVDACGNVFWAANERVFPGPNVFSVVLRELQR